MTKGVISCAVALIIGYVVSTLIYMSTTKKSDVIKLQDDDPIVEVVAQGDDYKIYRDTTTQTLYLYSIKSGEFTIMKDLNNNIRFYEGK